MLLPKFSLRWLILATTVCGLFFVVLAAGVAGKPWAVAVALGAGALLLTILLHGLLFLMGWAVSLVYQLSVPPQMPENPFATGQLPPQIIEPVDPD